MEKDHRLHINIKETLAILYSLQNLPEAFHQSMIQVYSDNKMAVSAINKMGAVHSMKRQSIMREICAITAQMEVTLKACHLKSSLNQAADHLSRAKHVLPQESTLSDEAFRDVCSIFKLEPQIDLFSTNIKKKLATYSSSVPHPRAV